MIVNKQLVHEVQKDVDFGMSFSGLVMYFIILTTGTVLFNAGVHQIDTVEQAAMALKPLAGNLGAGSQLLRLGWRDGTFGLGYELEGDGGCGFIRMGNPNFVSKRRESAQHERGGDDFKKSRVHRFSSVIRHYN